MSTANATTTSRSWTQLSTIEKQNNVSYNQQQRNNNPFLRESSSEESLDLAMASSSKAVVQEASKSETTRTIMQDEDNVDDNNEEERVPVAAGKSRSSPPCRPPAIIRTMSAPLATEDSGCPTTSSSDSSTPTPGSKDSDSSPSPPQNQNNGDCCQIEEDLNDCHPKEDSSSNEVLVPIGNITRYTGTGTNHIVSIIKPPQQHENIPIANLHEDNINNEIETADDTISDENTNNNEILEDLRQANSNGNATTTRPGPRTPILRKIGEKTPPGTLKKSRDRPTSSCKLWCEQYSQTFLAKTIDTPLPDPGSYSSDDDKDDETGH